MPFCFPVELNIYYANIIYYHGISDESRTVLLGFYLEKIQQMVNLKVTIPYLCFLSNSEIPALECQAFHPRPILCFLFLFRPLFLI